MTTPRKFVIIFFERSGSTLLVDLLNQHPDISCMHEVFNFKLKGPDETPDKAILESFESIYNKPNVKASGFKFKYPHQINRYSLVWNKIQDLKNDIRVIFLYRINRLKAAISSQNNKQLVALYGKSNFRKSEKFELPPLELNIDKAINYMKAREKADKYYYELIQDFRYKKAFKYEDLASNPLKIVKSIYDYLDVVTDFVPQINYTKISANTIEDAITNYPVLKERLQFTPWEKYLY